MSSKTAHDKNEICAINLIKDLMMLPTPVPFPKELDDSETARECYDYIVALKSIMLAFSKGDISYNINLKGSMAGMLKDQQANMRHLIWQVKMVSKGDFTQRVDFMGEFATAFNTMVHQMDATLNELKDRKEQLSRMTDNLKKEIAIRTKVETALKKSHKRYQELALKDPLTNLNNRRYFLELAIAEMRRMRRNGGVATIGMIDLDHFKNINDTYGHIVGDKCLQQISQMLLDRIRDVDIAARYGGEEFVFLLPGTSVKAGYLVAERIRSAIEDTALLIENHEINITVSIGVAEIIYNDIYNDDLNLFLTHTLNHADKALYSAKRLGKNVVFIYSDDEASE